ncbi:class I SAM-dependent methyltransferase [soil metagenome]
MPADDSDPKTRFTSRVSDYVKYRPSYPTEVLDVLRQRANLTAGITVADVGCGTGISSRFFITSGCNVIGVEPNAAMRTAAVEFLRGEKKFRAVDGSAEHTTLADESVDLVTAAQAFHWFDQAAFHAECVRILRPGGYLALIWNDRKLHGSPFLGGYEQLLLDLGVDYTAVRHNNISDPDLERFFEPAAMDKANIPSEQTFDYEGLLGRLMSSSYAPPPAHANYGPIVAELKALFDRSSQNGTVSMEYETLVYFGQIKQSASTLFGR